MLLKPLAVVIPEPLVMRDPVPHRTEPRGDEAIAPLSAMPLLRHETGIKQDAEVLGDGWAAHREMSRNRIDGAVGLNEEIQHPATCGMANCPKDIRLAIESHHHVANIRKKTLTRQVRSGLLSSMDAQVHQVSPHDTPRRGCVGAPVEGPMSVRKSGYREVPSNISRK